VVQTLLAAAVLLDLVVATLQTFQEAFNMSMISELLKTPAEARQEDIIKLRQVGNQTSGNLRAAPQGKYSGLPGIFSNYAAGIADQQATASDGLFRGITQAGGQLARAAGGAGLMDQQKAGQLQQTLQNASMSGNERNAMQNQEIMSGVQGAADQVAAYSNASKKAFAAGNQRLGMALEQKAGELSAAKVEAARQDELLTIKKKELGVKQTGVNIKAAELGIEQGKLSSVLGVELKDATLESQADAQMILLAATSEDGTITQEGKEQALRALKTQDKSPLVNVNTGGSSKFAEQLGKNQANKYDEGLTGVTSSNSTLRIAEISENLITEGVLSGTGASLILPVAELAQKLNLTTPEADKKLERTREYLQATGTAAVAALASGDYGSAQSMSDEDRKNAAKLQGNDINIPADSLRRILEYNVNSSISRIKTHNEVVRKLNKQYPEASLPLEFYVGQKKVYEGGVTYKYVGGGKWKKQ
jgi:hypothetical protein